MLTWKIMNTKEKGTDTMTTTNTKISAATWGRTAALALALANQILSATGHPILPIESAQLEQIVTAAFTIAAALPGWWFNNSFTAAAREADRTYDRLKAQGK